MKRLVAILFFLSLFLVGVGLIAPSFINWNSHKDKILAHVSPYLQRHIDVAGNISFKIIPQPEIILEFVTMSNLEGSKSKSFITLKRLETRLALAPLLEGRIEVEDVNFVNPVLNLEILKNGKVNWSDILKKEPSAAFGMIPRSVRFSRVTVSNGTINYLNQVTGFEKKVENLNLSLAANTLLGPYSIIGDMKYQHFPAKISVGMGAYNVETPIPVRVSFVPVEEGSLPKLGFDGVVDLQSGINIQGEMSIAQGKLGSLFDIDSLSEFGFMRRTVDTMTCALKFKNLEKTQLVLNDINAKFGKKGNLQGKITASFPSLRKPSVVFDLEGENLVITKKSDDLYMDVPGAFNGSLYFKGKNILWGGHKLRTVDISTIFDQKKWTIKSAQISLPGHSQIKLSGVMMPATDSVDYKKIRITTKDLGKLVSSLNPDDNSIFKSFSDTGFIKKFTLSSGLLISPSRINFFDIDAIVEDKAKISGNLNVDRSVLKPNFAAKLHLVNWDSSSFPKVAYQGFLRRVMRSGADMELTAKDYIRNDFKIPHMSFKGKIDERGIDIHELKGSLSDKESFTLKGHFASLFPASGMDVFYTMKAEKSADVAEVLGIDYPLLSAWGKADIKGKVRGDDVTEYNFTANGSVWDDEMMFSGKINGNEYTTKMVVKKIDLDKWLEEYLISVPSFSLKVRGDELIWQGQHIFNPVLTIEANPSLVIISDLEGSVFGGKLRADMGFTRKKNSLWSSSFKGSLRKADLDLLKKEMGFSGFSLGSGDVDFDLKSSKNTLSTFSGKIDIRTGVLIIERFNFSKLGSSVRLLTGLPYNFKKFISNIFHQNGVTVYRDVYGLFRMNSGQRLSIEKLKLKNAKGDMSVTGSTNMKTGKYNVSADLHLKQSKGFPIVKVRRTSKMSDYKVDSKPIRKFLLKKKLNIQSKPYKSTIKGIVKQLDEEEKSPVPDKKLDNKKKSPTLSPDLRFDVQRIMQEMQM